MTDVTKTMKPAEREALIQKRNQHYAGRYDFAAAKCWACGYDLVAHYGDEYVTKWISGCPACHRSFVD